MGLFRRAAPKLAVEPGMTPTYASDLADLEHLDPRDRSVLYLVHVEGLSYAEVADQFGMSEDACRQRAHRARTRLHREITAEEAPRHAR